MKNSLLSKKNRKLGKKDELFTVTKRTPDKNYGI